MNPGVLGSKITSGRVSAYTVPTDKQPESDGTAEWNSTTIVIIELTSQGITGLGYSYAHEAAARVAEELIRTEVLKGDPFDIPSLHSALDRKVRNWGRPGLVASAISAVDTCLWDLKARLFQVPLVGLLGKTRDEIQAYGSGGFTSYTKKELLDQLTSWADEGFSCVKMKIGTHPEEDVPRVTAVQKALNGKTQLYVDANGAYDRQQALHKAERFGELGVIWFEEPVTSDDRAGLHFLVERSPAVMKIAAGEYNYTLDDARLLIEAEAVDVMQTDVTRCGGVTNFLKIGQLCEICHYPYSAHTAPSIHATLCCALPAAMNVEYFYDHVRIEHMFFDGAITANKGLLTPDLSAHGLGLTLKRADAAKFQVFSATIN
ncbi:MAG TPA: enolase C-terminal domain-like protein [Bryobacteraceae bacterium]|nr:enolase C-terminal domain-like protein [Bryobacteraceae bacterium]